MAKKSELPLLQNLKAHSGRLHVTCTVLQEAASSEIPFQDTCKLERVTSISLSTHSISQTTRNTQSATQMTTLQMTIHSIAGEIHTFASSSLR